MSAEKAAGKADNSGGFPEPSMVEPSTFVDSQSHMFLEGNTALQTNGEAKAENSLVDG